MDSKLLLAFAILATGSSFPAASQCDEHLKQYYADVMQFYGEKDHREALTVQRLEKESLVIKQLSLSQSRQMLVARREDLKGAMQSGSPEETPAMRYYVCQLELRIAQLEGKVKADKPGQQANPGSGKSVDCVDLDFPDGRAVFTNRCPFRVTIGFCIQKDKGFFRPVKASQGEPRPNSIF